jgi:murein L,D-transpeptidase YafK
VKCKLVCFLALLSVLTTNLNAMSRKVNLEKAIDNAVARYGLRTEPQLRSWFRQANTQYPPKEIALLAFKKEQEVQLWARDDTHKSFWHHIHTYPLTAYSGHLGPKLKERDRQIPEGIYKLIAYNPFSAMHLSLMINYPNTFDRMHAEREGRKQLGGNIFLHGKSLSVGCLAVGDHAMDQLFLLTRRVGLRNVQVIIAPNDLRKAKPATFAFAKPSWLPELYAQLTKTLHQFRT